ncbi:MAG: ABC transporter permease [Bacilli bacterium]|nr:ABC transporter permease [Bacilli bacterium]
MEMNMKDFMKSLPNRTKKALISNGAYKAYSSIACVLIGLLIGFLIMVCLSPADAFYDFGMMITGGLKYYELEGFGNILATMAPLLCCGVGVIFAYKTGIFNIGAAGQYVLGSFGALVFALQFKQHWTICILMAMIFGALWACIPALLKVFCNVNEVISGIMLNWIALFFVNYSYQTYLSDIVDPANSFKTKVVSAISPSSVLPNFGADPNVIGNTFTCAFLIAILIAVVAFILMEKTTFGYQLKASGYNRHATKYAGINAKKNAIITMAISGAIIGLGAALYYLAGVEEWSAQISTSLPQVPWNGIIVAFIAQLNPIGAIFASGFLSLISVGSTATSQSVFPKEISDLITAVIVYLSGLTAVTLRFIPWIKAKLKKKKEGEPKEMALSVNGSKGGK